MQTDKQQTESSRAKAMLVNIDMHQQTILLLTAQLREAFCSTYFDVELGNKTIQQIEKEYGSEAAKNKTYVRDSKIAFLSHSFILGLRLRVFHRQ